MTVFGSATPATVVLCLLLLCPSPARRSARAQSTPTSTNVSTAGVISPTDITTWPITSPSPSPTPILSNGGTMAVRVLAHPPGSTFGDAVEVDFTWGSSSGESTYISAGVSTSGMIGRLLVCTTSCTCSIYDGYNSDLPRSPTTGTTIRMVRCGFDASTSKWSASVRTLAVDLAADTTTDSNSRMIFALGPSSGSTALKHKKKSVGTINFVTCVLSDVLLTLKVAAMVFGPLVVLLAFVAFAVYLHCKGGHVGPSNRWIVFLVFFILMGIWCILYAVMIGVGSTNLGLAAPLGIAFGHVAAFGVGLVTYTSLRFFNTWQLLIKYHIIFAVLVWIAATVHLVVMFTTWSPTPVHDIFGKFKNLCGVIAYGCMTVSLLVAMILRPFHYTGFRMTHLLFWFMAAGASCIHNLSPIFFLAPPSLALVLEKAWMIYQGHAGRIRAVEYFPQSEVTMLTVGCPLDVSGGVVVLSVDIEGCRLIRHPFSVAWWTAGEFVLMIKARGPFTTTIATAASTLELSQGTACQVSALTSHPCSYSDDALLTGHLMLIAGGVGITAILSIIRTMLHRGVRRSSLRFVTVIWSIRDASLLQAVMPFFTEAESSLGAFGWKVHIYNTSKDAPLPVVPPPQQRWCTLQSGRPQWSPLLQSHPHETTTAVVCGPPEFMLAVKDAAAQEPSVTVIEESFDFGTMWAPCASKERSPAGKVVSIHGDSGSSRRRVGRMLEEPMVAIRGMPEL